MKQQKYRHTHTQKQNVVLAVSLFYPDSAGGNEAVIGVDIVNNSVQSVVILTRAILSRNYSRLQIQSFSSVSSTPTLIPPTNVIPRRAEKP